MIIHGDCLDELRKLPENSVDSMVTDPPAGIAFMGKDWDSDKGGREHWIAWLKEVMQECLRVMKPGAHGFVWAIPRTSHWTATALEDAGFEVRDICTHIFGSGFPKSHNISKAIDKAAGAEREVVGKSNRHNSRAFGEAEGDADYGTYSGGVPMITAPSTPEAKKYDGWGTALKPSSEHWILIRKPCSEGTVAANVLKHGTGAINIDASRIGSGGDYTVHDAGSSGSGSLNWNIGEQKESSKEYTTTQGRWPANTLFSHSEGCFEHSCEEDCAVAVLDKQSGVLKNGGQNKTSKKGDGMFMEGSIEKGSSSFAGDSGGASRFFRTFSGEPCRFAYIAKASKSEKNAGCEGLPEKEKKTLNSFGDQSQFECPDGANRVGNKGSSLHSNHHPTCKPIKLLTYLMTMITPPGGTCIDPFLGSGSTGVAAIQSGFKFIGIEKEPEYIEIAKARIAHAVISKNST